MAVRIRLLSDLHIDRHDATPDLVADGADLIVLAGDLADGMAGVRWACEQQTRIGLPVVLLTGNHEYFGEDLAELDERIKLLSERQPGLHFLQCGKLQLGDVVILGCTLWTDFKLYPDIVHAREAAEDLMPDYTEIRIQSQRLRAADTASLHRQHRAWLERELVRAYNAGLRSVVVTHHAPSADCIPSRFAGSMKSPAFASDLTAIMREPWAPTLWLCGHLHHSIDLREGGTRILCNPRGYQSDYGNDSNRFSWEFVVEV